QVLSSPAFLAGETDTAFLDRHPEVFESLLAPDGLPLAGLAAALAGAARRRAGQPWGALPIGWRNVASAPQHTRFAAAGQTLDVSYRLDRDGRLVDPPVGVALVEAGP